MRSLQFAQGAGLRWGPALAYMLQLLVPDLQDEELICRQLVSDGLWHQAPPSGLLDPLYVSGLFWAVSSRERKTLP